MIEEELNIDDSIKNIPFAPRLHAHVYPHDYFVLENRNGVEYIGEYMQSRPKNTAPVWQQPYLLPCGDHCSDLALFQILTTEAEIKKINYVDAHFLKVPYEVLSKCIGLRQVYLTNTFIWLTMEAIVDIATITHGHVIQNSYCQLGGKGVHNSYFILRQIRYSINILAEVELTSRTIHHSQFSPFANSSSSSLFQFSPSFNHRIYSSLGSLRKQINKLMHTKRMFQKNGYTMNHYLSVECWLYMCDRLRGGIMDGEVDCVRRLFLYDLSQIKKKFHSQNITTIIVNF